MAWDDHWQKLSWSWGIFSFGRAFSKHPEWGVDVSLNGWLVLILPQVMFFIWAYPLGNRNGLINKPQCMKREHCMCSAQAVFVKDNSPMLCLLEEGTRESGVCCIYPWAHPDAAREFHASAIRHKQLARLPGCQLLSVCLQTKGTKERLIRCCPQSNKEASFCSKAVCLCRRTRVYSPALISRETREYPEWRCEDLLSTVLFWCAPRITKPLCWQQQLPSQSTSRSALSGESWFWYWSFVVNVSPGPSPK